jgi:hypothetical protein
MAPPTLPLCPEGELKGAQWRVHVRSMTNHILRNTRELELMEGLSRTLSSYPNRFLAHLIRPGRLPHPL